MRTAALVAPAQPGVGGLGGAMAAAAEGFAHRGWNVVHIGPPERPDALMSITSRRPLRRWKTLQRQAVRRNVRRRDETAPGRDLSYAVPGYLPCTGLTVLHQATFHPRTVREQIERARARTGGGAGFISRWEMRDLLTEIERADIVRTESPAVRRDLIAHGVPSDKVVQAWPGVDLERFHPASKAQRPRVAFVGTFSLWKRADVLADLAHALRGKAEFCAIGGPVCPWSRRLMADVPISGSNSTVRELLATSHLLVLPSASDGFGYVVLEAMASGTVPLVTPEVGASDLVQRLHPSLVQPVTNFVDAAAEMIASPDLEVWSLAARTLAEQFDRPSRAVQAVDAVLDRLGIDDAS